MHTDIDTIKIVMSIDEAREFSQQMSLVFDHFASAVNAHGMTSIDQLMLDYPAVSKFYEMLKIYQSSQTDLPF